MSTLNEKLREGQERLASALRAAGNTTKRVLIVDDESDTAGAIAHLAEECKWEAKTVWSGEHALQELRRNHYHLVLLDFKMPGMNGVEVLRELRTFKPSQAVILITGYADAPLIASALELGVITIMIKPVTPQDMTNALVRGIL